LPNPLIPSQADHKFSDFFKMLENELKAGTKIHPVLSVLLILILAGFGFATGGVAAAYLYVPFYDGTETELFNALQSFGASREMKFVLYGMQAGASICGLILAPYIFLKAQQKSLSSFFESRTEILPIIITALLVVIFMAFNSFFIQWNENVHFPDFLKNFETWARQYEDAAEQQTRVLTTFEGSIDLIVALLVIAVIPAIGEELLFRGIIQNQLFRGTRNIHASIWLAAILFSAIHVQFFGFVPRLLLGALFGYLYYWSGNLWFPIVAHFVNNGFSVLAMYFYQQGKLEFDLEKTESVPANVVMISGVLTAGLLFYFYKYFQNRKPRTDYL
jgi:membrane protease YdiL (CAAX protease family)